LIQLFYSIQRGTYIEVQEVYWLFP